MEKQALGFQREMEMDIYYENVNIGFFEASWLFVENKIMVELKALIKLEDVHLAQAMNYCQAYNLPIGLLINFGAKSLEFKARLQCEPPKTKSSELGFMGFEDDRIKGVYN